MIRVGRRQYHKGGYTDPTYPDFKPIVSLTKSTPYGSLGPYELKNDKGQILENIWQFSKVYEWIPESLQSYSRYDNTLIWQHGPETFVLDNGELTKEYLSWRDKGMNNEYAVRYPVTYSHRNKCLYALKELPDDYIPKEEEKLDYIQSRKEIYLPLYLELVRKESKYQRLLRYLREGQNLLIIEVDGPHQESLDYYKDKYDVRNDFIEADSMPVTWENLDIMLNDDKHPFGHGYCLAWALLEDIEDVEIMEG